MLSTTTEKETKTKAALKKLPPEILGEVASFLNAKDIAHLGATSTHFRKSLTNEVFARKTLLNYSIVQIENSFGLFFLDNNGKVWYRPASHHLKSQAFLLNLAHIKAMASDDENILFLDSQGKVFALGFNKHGELGLGEIKYSIKSLLGFGNTPYANEETMVPLSTKIKQIAMGSHNSFFLDDAGNVFAAGSNKDGQLGLGFITQQNTPLKIEDLPKIKKIACDKTTTIFIAENGSVWQCGEYGFRAEAQFVPQQISSLKDMIDVSLFRGLKLYRNTRGEVWVSYSYENQIITNKIPGLTHIQLIQYSAYEIFFVNDAGKVWIADYYSMRRSLTQANFLFLQSNALPVKRVLASNLETYLQNEEGVEWIYKLNDSKSLKILEPECELILDCSVIPHQQTKLGAEISKPLTIKIDVKGNLTIHRLYERSKSIWPFNFMIEHQLNIIQACHLSIDRLIELANSNKKENECYYLAILNLLKTQDAGTRLYYLAKLEKCAWMNNKDFTSILFYSPIYSSKKKHLIHIDTGQNKLRKIAQAFMQIDDYLNYDLANDKKFELQADFKNILEKINNGEIKNNTELKAYFHTNAYCFRQKTFFTLFGYEIKGFKLFSKYHHLLENFAAVLGNDEEAFKYLKNITQIVSERSVLLENDGRHEYLVNR